MCGKRPHEILVCVDLLRPTAPVIAGTSHNARSVTPPPHLLRRLQDPRERFALWHGHPKTDENLGIAIPSTGDIAFTIHHGVASLATINRNAEIMVIRATEPRLIPASSVLHWTTEAQKIMEDKIISEKGPFLFMDERTYIESVTRVGEACLSANIEETLIEAELPLRDRAIKDGRWLAKKTNRNEGTPAQIAQLYALNTMQDSRPRRNLKSIKQEKPGPQESRQWKRKSQTPRER